jgi:hypothetical protein
VSLEVRILQKSDQLVHPVSQKSLVVELWLALKSVMKKEKWLKNKASSCSENYLEMLGAIFYVT